MINEIVRIHKLGIKNRQDTMKKYLEIKEPTILEKYYIPSNYIIHTVDDKTQTKSLPSTYTAYMLYTYVTVDE